VSLIKLQSTPLNEASRLHYAPGAGRTEQVNQHRVISVQRLKPFIKLLASKGTHIQPLLEQLGIPLKCLIEPHAKIPLEQYFMLIRRASQLHPNEQFAAQLGQQFHLSNDGLLSYRIMSSKSVNDAIIRLAQYQFLLSDLVSIHIDYKQDYAALVVEMNTHLGDCEPFFVEYIFSVAFATGKFCLGHEALPLSFHFRYPKHSCHANLSDYLTEDLEFNSARTEIRIPNHLLQKSLIFSNEGVSEQIDQACKSAKNQLERNDSLVHKVQELLKTAPHQLLTLEQAAEACFLTPRTLRKQLAKHQVNYRELLESERKHRAIEALQQTPASLEHVASTLGYRDTSSFSRAFKKWFGIAPGQYRKTNIRGDNLANN